MSDMHKHCSATSTRQIFYAAQIRLHTNTCTHIEIHPFYIIISPATETLELVRALYLSFSLSLICIRNLFSHFASHCYSAKSCSSILLLLLVDLIRLPDEITNAEKAETCRHQKDRRNKRSSIQFQDLCYNSRTKLHICVKNIQ